MRTNWVIVKFDSEGYPWIIMGGLTEEKAMIYCQAYPDAQYGPFENFFDEDDEDDGE